MEAAIKGRGMSGGMTMSSARLTQIKQMNDKMAGRGSGFSSFAAAAEQKRASPTGVPDLPQVDKDFMKRRERAKSGKHVDGLLAAERLKELKERTRLDDMETAERNAELRMLQEMWQEEEDQRLGAKALRLAQAGYNAMQVVSVERPGSARVALARPASQGSAAMRVMPHTRGRPPSALNQTRRTNHPRSLQPLGERPKDAGPITEWGFAGQPLLAPLPGGGLKEDLVRPTSAFAIRTAERHVRERERAEVKAMEQELEEMTKGGGRRSIAWWLFCCWIRPAERRRTNTCMPKRSNMSQAEKDAEEKARAAAERKGDPKKLKAQQEALRAAKARMTKERLTQAEKAASERRKEVAEQRRVDEAERKRKEDAVQEGRKIVAAAMGNSWDVENKNAAKEEFVSRRDRAADEVDTDDRRIDPDERRPSRKKAVNFDSSGRVKRKGRTKKVAALKEEKAKQKAEAKTAEERRSQENNDAFLSSHTGGRGPPKGNRPSSREKQRRSPPREQESPKQRQPSKQQQDLRSRSFEIDRKVAIYVAEEGMSHDDALKRAQQESEEQQKR